jgi:ubiquitin C-terminal hydrolase
VQVQRGRCLKSGRTFKAHAKVNIPAELDLSEFLWQGDPQSGAATLPSRRALYELVGRIDHFGGSLDSGHYTSAVHIDQVGWHNCNDEKVTLMKCAPTGLSSSAYVLLFRRRRLS